MPPETFVPQWPLPGTIWTYPARLVTVHDGDTMRVDIALTHELIIHDVDIRLLGCDTYELSDLPLGPQAKAFTAAWLATGILSILTHNRRDSFGRLLASIHKDSVTGPRSLSDSLAAAKLTTGKFTNTTIKTPNPDPVSPIQNP